MDKETILNNYAKIGINSQAELYDFVVNNDKVIVSDKNYNLNNSNEAMEFMAIFLQALGFEVIRLFLESCVKHYD